MFLINKYAFKYIVFSQENWYSWISVESNQISEENTAAENNTFFYEANCAVLMVGFLRF